LAFEFNGLLVELRDALFEAVDFPFGVRVLVSESFILFFEAFELPLEVGLVVGFPAEGFDLLLIDGDLLLEAFGLVFKGRVVVGVR
jgi:hypothetical protein